MNRSKRKTLGLLRNLAIGVPVVGVAGFFSVRSVQATICEADLSKIGRGRAAIVQIHDPSCQLCRTLQKQTRKSLRAHNDADYHFLVANINTAEGGALAGHYNVPHVTLLLFDKTGKMVQTFRGPAEQTEIDQLISDHLLRHG